MADSFLKAFQEYLTEMKLPSKDKGYSEGQLEATKEHLKDMREIAFKLLEVSC